MADVAVGCLQYTDDVLHKGERQQQAHTGDIGRKEGSIGLAF